MPVAAKTKQFESEAALCAAFIAAIDSAQWTAYPETAGWDILLVRGADGIQVGVEAKLRLNLDVVNQVVEEYGSHAATSPGPDCRAVLVPSGDAGCFDRIAAYIGFTIIRMRPPAPAGVRRHSFDPALPGFPRDCWEYWHEWCPGRRHRLPEYVPDVAAGSPAPLQLTDWKISAIKIAVTLERRGFVTRADFKFHGIDHRRWLAAESPWLRVSDGRWVSGPRLPDFKAMHPRNYIEIAADAEKWMPPVVDRMV